MRTCVYDPFQYGDYNDARAAAVEEERLFNDKMVSCSKVNGVVKRLEVREDGIPTFAQRKRCYDFAGARRARACVCACGLSLSLSWAPRGTRGDPRGSTP